MGETWVMDRDFGPLKFETEVDGQWNENERQAIDATIKNMVRVRDERAAQAARDAKFALEGTAAETVGAIGGGLAGAALTRSPTGTRGGAALGSSLLAREGTRAGILAASSLGAGLGRLVFDSTNSAYEALGIQPAATASSLEQTTIRAMEAAEGQAVGGLIVGGAARVAKGAARSVLGLDVPKATTQLAEAGKLGVNLALENVSTNPIITGYRNSLGRLPGVTGVFTKPGPIQRLRGQPSPSERVAGEVGDAMGRFGLHPFDPIVSVTEASGGITDAAVRRYDAIDKMVDRAWERARIQANTAGAFYNPANLKTTATGILKELKEGTPTFIGPKGNTLPVSQAKRDQRLDMFIRQVSNLEDYQTIPQYVELVKDINKRMSRANPTQQRELTLLKRAAERDLAAANMPPEIAESIRSANRVSAWKKQFYSGKIPTALEKIDRPMFSRESQGTKPIDDALKIAFQMDDLAAMKETRVTIGRPAFKNATSAYLDDVFARSVKRSESGQTFFDVDQVARDLGLVTGGQRRRASLDYALKESGSSVNSKDLEQLLGILGQYQKQGMVPDASTYLARRTLLSGASVATTGLGGFIAGSYLGQNTQMNVGLGLVSMLIFAGGARSLGKWVSRPGRLPILLKALDPNSQRTGSTAATAAGIAAMKDFSREWLRAEMRLRGGDKREGPTETEVNMFYNQFLANMGKPTMVAGPRLGLAQ